MVPLTQSSLVLPEMMIFDQLEAFSEFCGNVVYRCQIVKLYLLVAGCITSRHRHRLRLATARCCLWLGNVSYCYIS